MNSHTVLTPLQRLEALCDPGSVHLIRSHSTRADAPDEIYEQDGVIGASGTVAGRPVVCFAQDRSAAGGSLGKAQADAIIRVLNLAQHEQVPVVGFVESAGARIHEGVRALGGYGRVFRMNIALSRQVPQISVVTGVTAGGGCYSPALTDFVVMTSKARMFLTGPGVVREVTGEEVTAEQLGSVRVQGRNGVCDLVVLDDIEAMVAVRQLLSLLPQNAMQVPPRADPVAPLCSDPSVSVPHKPSRVYDIRDVIKALTDGGMFLELCPRWAKNMVTGLARIDGRALGFVANQPRHLGGVIDVGASAKASRFITTCDAFGLPLIVLVDTPGFMPGTRQENQAIIRQGAGLLRAFAEATVGKVTVVIRKAYGGGFITMNSKDLGADLALAWPGATVGVLGARQAVQIIHRREIAEAREPLHELNRRTALYAAQHEDPFSAVREDVIDEVIRPPETRARLCRALDALSVKGAVARGGAARGVTIQSDIPDANGRVTVCMTGPRDTGSRRRRSKR